AGRVIGTRVCQLSQTGLARLRAAGSAVGKSAASLAARRRPGRAGGRTVAAPGPAPRSPGRAQGLATRREVLPRPPLHVLSAGGHSGGRGGASRSSVQYLSVPSGARDATDR